MEQLVLHAQKRIAQSCNKSVISLLQVAVISRMRDAFAGLVLAQILRQPVIMLHVLTSCSIPANLLQGVLTT